MDVSILIVNYNTKDITKNCIDSIVNQTKEIDYEIILVDNASTDGSAEFFANHKHIEFIASKVNLGFGRANNLGLTAASGDYIFLLNSDTILLNNAVNEFYNAMRSLPEHVACLGTKLLAADGVSKNHSYAVFPSISSVFTELVNIYLPFTNKKTKPRNSDTFKVDVIIGADLFIRRTVINELGLFDPDFFMYLEETNMQLRYSKAGYESRIISKPKIIHLEKASDPTGGLSCSSKIIYFEGMFLYMRKRYALIPYYIARFLCLGYLVLLLRKNYALKEKLILIRFFLKPNLSVTSTSLQSKEMQLLSVN